MTVYNSLILRHRIFSSGTKEFAMIGLHLGENSSFVTRLYSNMLHRCVPTRLWVQSKKFIGSEIHEAAETGREEVFTS